MRVVNDTKVQRLITMELTEGELAYIVSGLGKVSPYEITRNHCYRTILPLWEGHDFHDKLRDALGGR